MFCSKCGKNIGDHSLFCSFCGNKMSEATPTNEENARKTYIPPPPPSIWPPPSITVLPPPSIFGEMRTVYARATFLMVIQFIMVLISPIAGSFKFTTYTMVDTAIFLIGIGITSMVFIDFNEKRQKQWLYGGAATFLIGMMTLVINLLFATSKIF